MSAVIEIESQLQQARRGRASRAQGRFPAVACAVLLALSLGLASAGVARAQSDAPSNDELARRIEALAAELDDLTHGEVAAPLVSRHGFGPAASKIYSVQEGFSFGGYGEMVYNNFSDSREDDTPSGARDRIDFLRQILYVGYKFDAHVLFNAEIEFEHASTGKSGEVSVEFAQVDFLITPEFNARAGLLLVPMGFVNELHEPPIFFGVERPTLERVLIPSTWRTNGVGIFGEPQGRAAGLQYRAYLIESLVSSATSGPRFGASGLRSGRQSGSKALAEDLAGVIRADYERQGIRVGGSLFFGNTSQGARADLGAGPRDFGGFTTVYEAHAQLRQRGVQLRALVAGADVQDAAEINAVNGFTGSESVGSSLLGWYLELGWDVLSTLKPGTRFAVSPYVRYSEVDTQRDVPSGFSANPENDQRIATFGVAFHPHSQVVVKGDFQLRRNEADTGINQWNLGLGYLF